MVHNTEKLQLSFFPKRVIALTTVGSNHQNTENIRFWWPFLVENQVFIKREKFRFLCCRLMFCVIFGQTIPKITKNVHWVHASTLKRIFSLLKKKNTHGKRSLNTTFESKLYSFIMLSTFLISFCEGLLYQSYRNHVLNDFEMLSLGQKILKDQ